MTFNPPKIEDNHTGYTREQIDTFALLGEFQNNWRQRWVSVYADPGDPRAVITIGVGRHDIAICREPRSLYAGRIKYDDWSDYN